MKVQTDDQSQRGKPFYSSERITKNKVEWLNLVDELGNVSKACQMMGLSRDTFTSLRL